MVTTSCSAWGWRTTSTSSSGTAVRRARKSKPTCTYWQTGFPFRGTVPGQLDREKATEAANAIAKERNFVQSQDIGKVNKAEIKEAMDGVLKKMQGFDFTKFKEELGKRGFKVREARASTGKLNGYYVTARSGTEYKASEIGKGYTLAHIERTQSKLKCNSMNISHGNNSHPEAAASNVKQGQYSPRKRKIQRQG